MPTPEYLVRSTARQAPGTALERLGPHTFRAEAHSFGPFAVFGGELAAQALAAAQQTVEPDRQPVSLRVEYVSPGRAAPPFVLEVEPLRDGRSMSRRAVCTRQEGRVVLHAEVALATEQRDGMGLDQPARAVPSTLDLPAPLDVRATMTSPVDWRPVDSNGVHAWLGVPGAARGDPLLWCAAVVFASDLSLPWRAWDALGFDRVTPGMAGMTVDHSVWFHRVAPDEQWLLFEQSCLSVANGRGLCLSQVYDRRGRPLVTVVQGTTLTMSAAEADAPNDTAPGLGHLT